MSNQKVELADGSEIPSDNSHKEIMENGQQKGYVVLTAEERAKGFVRPLERSYRHTKCDAITTIALPIAETFARDPAFYTATFCVNCREHFLLDEFVWYNTGKRVGS